MNIKLLGLLFFACLISSCSSHQEIGYFKDIDKEIANISLPSDYQVRIEPDDELIIRVTSQIPEATAKYNVPQSNGAMTRGSSAIPTSTYLNSYVVKPDGNIIFPVLGKIYVKGKTVTQIADELTTEISKEVKDPYVDVALHNYKVSVLGAVTNPGFVNVSSERFSILDAIAAAGDLSIEGQRQNVLLIREIDGKKVYQRIDLTKSDIFKSPYYYLKQNDVIYIEPTTVSRNNAQYDTNNSFKLSVVSTIVSAVSVIASLVIALSIR